MLILFILIAILLILIIGALLWAYYKVFYSPKKDMSETESPIVLSNHPFSKPVQTHIEELANTPCEYCKTRSFDKLLLSARYYKGADDKPLCICFHGYRGSALRDYSGIGLYLIYEGYPVLIVDERAHWHSKGHTITFGIKERYDVLTWIRYANQRFGNEKPI